MHRKSYEIGASRDPSDYLNSDCDSEMFEQKVQQKVRRREEENDVKRPHLVKTQRQYNTLMRLYLRTGTWTQRFMEKISDKVGLTPS